MNQIIIDRAERLFILARDYLIGEDSSDPHIGEAYRYGILVTQGPRIFLNTFREGRLALDIEMINEGLWIFRGSIPGEPGLSVAEMELVHTHNGEVNKRSAPAASNVRFIGLSEVAR